MDEIQKSVKTCLNKYADFNGRAARPEFWWFVLFWIVVLAVTGLVSKYLYAIAALALVVPGLAVGARRLHDTGKSGWYQLIGLIPLVGGLVVLYLMAQQGEPAANRWGSPPDTAPMSSAVAPGQQ
ncbi:DUF805 domain-containing protein [Caenimonas terrae]|uniref:DUF805 domain-containing protein n=1 Tax=Caenimonas terrae TaxID=696074 RepID=A0ABW0N6A1_9BURK